MRNFCCEPDYVGTDDCTNVDCDFEPRYGKCVPMADCDDEDYFFN